MHWQNTGRDLVTSASAILQVWFGLDRFCLSLFGSINFTFSIHHQHRAELAMNSPNFANADRCMQPYLRPTYYANL
jgi:hypothetical protein